MTINQINDERERVYRCLDEYWKHTSVLRTWFVGYGIGAFDFWLRIQNFLEIMSWKKFGL